MVPNEVVLRVPDIKVLDMPFSLHAKARHAQDVPSPPKSNVPTHPPPKPVASLSSSVPEFKVRDADPTFNMPKVDVPFFLMPKFDIPNMLICTPKVDMPKFEVPAKPKFDMPLSQTWGNICGGNGVNVHPYAHP